MAGADTEHFMHGSLGWRVRLAAAFGVVYLVWGSTYLAIRVGVVHLPPALFAGVRFVIAGLVLGLYARLSGQAFPEGMREWRTIALAGVLMLVGANGLVVWGEQWVPSNQAALIVATSALWIAGLGTLGAQGHPLSRQSKVGLAIGFGGVAALLLSRQGYSLDHLWGQLAILLSTLFWSSGSIYVKRRKPTTPPLMTAALQMGIAGLVLCTLGIAAGELPRWVWEPSALYALGYLIVFGSMLAYGAYMWLLHQVRPALLGTYAYVNPAVAVLLGWWILGETLSPVQLIGMAVILLGVLLVSTADLERSFR
jgi:drug/metabolite transporter (DMT)-like permease